MFGGGEVKRQVADLGAQVAQLKSRVEALAAQRAQPPAPAPVTVEAPAAGPGLGEIVAVAEFHTRELSAMAAEVLQLGYGYDLDTVQLTWNRFAMGDRQAFFSALTGPGGEGLAVHLANAAEDEDYGEDFQKALARLVDNGRKFLASMEGFDRRGVVLDYYRNGPLGQFLSAVHETTAIGVAAAEE